MLPNLKTSVALVFLGCASVGRTTPTLESITVNEIRAGLNAYAEANDGRQATNWTQVGQFINLLECNRRLLLETESCPVEANYVFITTPVLKLIRPEGHVVLIRRSPFKHPTYGLGRYLILRRENEFITSWLQESALYELLAKTGTALPEPDLQEVRTAKQAIEKLIAKEKVERKIILQNAPRPAWGEIWVVYRDRLKALFLKQSRASGASGQTAQLRPVPVVVAGLLLVGILACAVRWCFRRKLSSIPPK